MRLRIVGGQFIRRNEYSAPAVDELVGLIIGDIDPQHYERDIIVKSRSGELQRISSIKPCYMPFQYPLLYVFGQPSYVPDLPYNYEAEAAARITRKYITMTEYYCYRLHIHSNESDHFFRSGKLFQQICVDMFACVDQARAWYILDNQAALRTDSYANIQAAALEGDMYRRELGKRVVLLASYVGSPRYMFQNYEDAVTICKHLGPPHLFVTFTCNALWPEITRNLLNGSPALIGLIWFVVSSR